jgi:hypothetical protein
MKTVFIAAAQPNNENGIYRCRTAQQRVSVKQTLKQRFPWPTRLVHSARLLSDCMRWVLCLTS